MLLRALNRIPRRYVYRCPCGATEARGTLDDVSANHDALERCPTCERGLTLVGPEDIVDQTQREPKTR